jgi:DNA-binding LacI/PurR family transcriptional regulator
MPNYKRERLTMGVLAGWQVYEGTNPNRRLEVTFRGIAAEARSQGYNLLLACGMGARVEPRGVHPAWPTLSPETDFVPVGPWNVDGLIVITPVQDEERVAYIQELMRGGFPVVFVGSGEGQPAVVPDNATGIHQALAHLAEHGHHQVAFIAGDPLDSGESMERLMVFQSALAQHNLEFDWHRMAYGLNHQAGGYQAMQTILKNGAPFTAVMASNDASALGALRALQAAGRRVPQDVAVIGFDDHPEAAVHVPHSPA